MSACAGRYDVSSIVDYKPSIVKLMNTHYCWKLHFKTHEIFPT